LTGDTVFGPAFLQLEGIPLARMEQEVKVPCCRHGNLGKGQGPVEGYGIRGQEGRCCLIINEKLMECF
jgi:hypothetical protein